MAWLQKRPQVSNPAVFYTVGLQKTILVVGLGNPGPEYRNTRHNVGFLCLDEFVATTNEMTPWILKKDLKCQLSTGQLGETRVLAMKPTTFMNLSGEAVAAVIAFYKISAADVTVIHDEIDIDFGQIRLRMGGSSAGHNGIKSVTSHLGEDYGRIRIGIGPKKPPQIDSADFVLQSFTASEEKQLLNLTREITAFLNEHIFSGSPLPHETRNFLV